jgi:hypothetical protein
LLGGCGESHETGGSCEAGQCLGVMGDYMNGPGGTTKHLHFEIETPVPKSSVIADHEVPAPKTRSSTVVSSAVRYEGAHDRADRQCLRRMGLSRLEMRFAGCGISEARNCGLLFHDEDSDRCGRQLEGVNKLWLKKISSLHPCHKPGARKGTP